ncbi:uncharacterized protein KY384_008840 [Bacidia gigantensis]|uniref:uncharacterized protein n=1 Tax=Bacidia gigantensis TaxID=2732470 RepID=UPI001D052646|nr:uncharacterized protein KY384_008840 [Bacidia gigantensis]KAG8525196.1 hypothetical protein KY384_008840 [Bacidia gigantensis]
MKQNGTGRRISPPETPEPDLQNGLFDEWSWSLPAGDLHQPQHQPTGATTALLDPARPLSTTGAPAHGYGLQTPILDQDQTDLAKTDYQNVCSMPDAMSFPVTAIPTMAPSMPRKLSLDENGRDRTKLGEKEFAVLLQLCSKLQGHLAQVGGSVTNQAPNGPTMTPSMSPAISAARLREMLEDISKSSDVIFGLYGQGDLSKPTAQLVENLDHASTSLAIAVVFKVFQVCDTVLSCNSLKSQGLNDLLLQKRLDFNLMQARIVAAKIEEMTQGGLAVSRKVALNATGVEQKLRAIS